MPKEIVKVCVRAKRTSKFIVTSDLVHIAGYPPGNYDFHGVPVVLEANGYLHRKVALQLAGSTSTMTECMNFLASIKDTDEKELTKMGYENALELLNTTVEEARIDQAPKTTYDGQKFSLKRKTPLR